MKTLTRHFGLAGYDWTLLRRDGMAGLTVASVAVPQAMAYALLAGVPPVVGLYTAVVVTALGSLFGSSAHLINGPTSAVSLVVFSVVAGAGSGPDDPGRLGLVALVAVLAGLIQIGLALLKLGGLGRYFSEAVLLGFMAGAGVLEALIQLPTALGLQPAGQAADHLLFRLWRTFSQGGPADVRSLAITLGTVALIGGLHRLSGRWKVRLPEMLLSLALVSLLVSLLDLAPVGAGNNHLPLECGLPTPRAPVPPPGGLPSVGAIGGAALAIALLGLAEAVAMAKALAAWSGQGLDYNRECLAQGLANVGGGLFGCLPGSGSLSRSAINYHAGAATRLSGLVAAAGVAAALGLFAPLAGRVPPPALAGILLWTAWRLVEPRRLWKCLRSSRTAAAEVLATALVGVFVGIEYALLAGLAAFLLCRSLRGDTSANPDRDCPAVVPVGAVAKVPEARPPTYNASDSHTTRPSPDLPTSCGGRQASARGPCPQVLPIATRQVKASKEAACPGHSCCRPSPSH
jgi:SulP family sulfate permease